MLTGRIVISVKTFWDTNATRGRIDTTTHSRGEDTNGSGKPVVTIEPREQRTCGGAHTIPSRIEIRTSRRNSRVETVN
jgi:hypothetical protein